MADDNVSASDFANASIINITVRTPYPIHDRTEINFAYFVVLGIIIVTGFVCNTLSVLVFIKSKALRQSTTGLYLLSLAIADLLFLIGETLRWLDTKDYIPGYDFLKYSSASCQFVFSLRYAAKLTSAWITVSITAERFFIVVFPLRASSVCTCKKAVIVILVTYAACFVVGGLASLTMDTFMYHGRLMCGYKDPYMYNVYSWVVLRVGSLLLPGLVIFLLTFAICVRLARAKEKRERRLSESQGQIQKATQGSSGRSLGGNGMKNQLTAMLLCVAIAFVILRTPYTIMFYVHDRKYDLIDQTDMDSEYVIYVIYKATDLIAALNYAVNFFLYCISGSIFRRQFLMMLRCLSDKDAAAAMSKYGANNLQYSTHGLSVHGHLSLGGGKGPNSVAANHVLSRNLSRSDIGKLDRL